MKRILLIGLLIFVIGLVGCSNSTGKVILSDGHSDSAEHLAEHELAEKVSGQSFTKEVPDNARLLTLSIEGMTCPSCSLGEASVYELLDGVIEAKILYNEGLGKVIYDPLKVEPEEIVKVATYPASIINDEVFKNSQRPHIHADFKVYIDNKPIDFSQQKYQLQHKYIHLEDGNGDVMHIHEEDVTFGIFLNTLKINFNNLCIIIPTEGSFCKKDNKELTFYVNGIENNEYENYLVKNADKILITYGKGDVNSQLDSITGFAIK